MSDTPREVFPLAAVYAAVTTAASFCEHEGTSKVKGEDIPATGVGLKDYVLPLLHCLYPVQAAVEITEGKDTVVDLRKDVDLDRLLDGKHRGLRPAWVVDIRKRKGADLNKAWAFRALISVHLLAGADFSAFYLAKALEAVGKAQTLEQVREALQDLHVHVRITEE